jgi:hypothetical protein
VVMKAGKVLQAMVLATRSRQDHQVTRTKEMVLAGINHNPLIPI